MINYKLVIAYDGTKYNGFQKQTSHPEKTIQGKLENVLSLLFEETISLIGSGRTDAGVHSKGQVCNFHCETHKSTEEMLTYLATYLPKDISILNLSIASPRFHSRYNVLRKCYTYTVDTGLFPDPFTVRYAYHMPSALNLSAMEEAASYLVGTHDFKSFTSLKSKSKSTTRHLESIDIKKDGNKVFFTYTGNGFLQHMVRILTGTLLEVGIGQRSAASIVTSLEALSRSEAGPTAPAHGLCMERVYY